MSFSGWMVNQTVANPNYGMLLSIRKQWTTETHDTLDGSPGNYAEWKQKPIPKDYIIYDFIYVTFFEMTKF